MLRVPPSEPQNQSVMVLRFAEHGRPRCPPIEDLKTRGIKLIECSSPEAVRQAMSSGCRVGLVLVTTASELQHLDGCEQHVANGKVAWVGLIGQDLISLPRIREFISEHLFNFITLPADIGHIVLTLRDAWGMAYVRDTRQPTARPPATEGIEGMMVGKTPQMQRLFAQIHKVARTGASVLITGPSGTGKELAALSIHRQSPRCDAPFIAVNCGAIPPPLFQSELFGYEKGAFTGAGQRKTGRIEAAQGGTLFLDEIGDMPFDMQVNLLRFLQEKAVVRVGGNETIDIDVRVIAATHIDLEQAVADGRFREDLYYRINVICIDIPPLADRGQDIEDLAMHYFVKYARSHNRSLRGFSRAAMNAMLSHSWPGNVRELVNRVQRAAVMAEGRFIQPEDLGFQSESGQAGLMSLEDARAAAESMMIRRALSQSRNQISRAAALLGVSRVTLYRLIEKYNIRPDMVASAGPSFLNGGPRDVEVRK